MIMNEPLSALSICNLALSKMGEAPLSSLEPNGSSTAKLCHLHYHPTRKEVLCSAPWPFATKSITLETEDAVEEASPLTGPLSRYCWYLLPPDCLRILHARSHDWVLQGRSIYAKSNPLELTYIYNCENVESLDPLFVDAFATKLAEKLCVPITSSNTMRRQFTEEYYKMILPLAAHTSVAQSFSNDSHPLREFLRKNTYPHYRDEDCE